jgi:opacity protein-like surface antigen
MRGLSMTDRPFSTLAAACALVLCAFGPARAQDAQYWTNDYGNRARLLGGAMVGSASDLSAVYYNPGRLALLESAQAFLTGYVFNHDHLSLTNPVAPADGITSSRFDAVAALIAGELRFKFLGDSRLAYSFMNRHDFEIRLSDEVIFDDPDPVEAPDLELLAGNVGYQTRLSEYWAGFTWAKPLGSGLGLGISTFVSVRSQRARSNAEFQELTDRGEATVVSRLRDYSYNSWRVLPKIGLGWEREPWSLGFTVTSPGVKLWGSGDETLNASVVGQAEAPDGTLPTYIAVDSQEDIPSTYNSPWAVAIGAAYLFSSSTRAHFTAEWFSSNNRTILDAEPFVPQTGGELLDPSVHLEMKSLANVGIGVEHVFTEKLTSYASFRTDFSGAAEPIPSETTFAIWDLYHLGAGVQATVGRSDFTLGLMYSRGTQTRPNALVDLGLEGKNGLLSEETKYSFTRLTLLLGFQLAFAPELGTG